MTEILCAKSHEFVYEKNGYYYIGVTDILLNKLGEIQYIEFPQIGEFYTKGEIFGYLEAEIMATELFMPVTGRVEEINLILKETPNAVNKSNPIDNWLIKISTNFYEEDKKDLIDYNKYKEEDK